MSDIGMPSLDKRSQKTIRDEPKVEQSRQTLEDALKAARAGGILDAKSNVEKAWQEFNGAYHPDEASLGDTQNFLDAAKWVLQQAPNAAGLPVIESLTIETAKASLISANVRMMKKDGTTAFQKTQQSWTLLQQAFPTGVPVDRFNNYFASLKSILENTAPQMIPLFNDVILLRQGLNLENVDKEKKLRELNWTRDMLVALAGRVLCYAFDEKSGPGLDDQARAFRAGAGETVILMWERNKLKEKQTPDWQGRYNSVLKRLKDISLGL